MEETKFCPHCGNPIEPGASYCSKCGAFVGTGETEKNDSNQTYSNVDNTNNRSYYSSSYSNRSYNSADDSNGTMSLVFGILSFFFFGLIFGILAIVYAGKCDKSNAKAKVGRILGIIAIVAWAMFAIIYVIVIATTLANGGDISAALSAY